MNGNGGKEDIPQPQQPPPQLSCPLVNAPCIEYNTKDGKPALRCGWVMQVPIPHPQIAGQMVMAQGCKIDVMIKMLNEVQGMVASLMQGAHGQPQTKVTKRFIDDILRKDK